MTRIKGATHALKRRRSILSLAKGYRNGRSTKESQAREAVLHAGNHAFAHRRDRKNDFRKLWNVKINAAVRPLGTTYSKFINTLKIKNILLDRKILAQLAEFQPTIFTSVVNQIEK